MDDDSGQVLASANTDKALPPASLTKMMIAPGSACGRHCQGQFWQG
jgi:hypothetical protein